MKKKLVKILSFMLIVILSFCLLTACAGGGAGADIDNDTNIEDDKDNNGGGSEEKPADPEAPVDSKITEKEWKDILLLENYCNVSFVAEIVKNSDPLDKTNYSKFVVKNDYISTTVGNVYSEATMIYEGETTHDELGYFEITEDKKTYQYTKNEADEWVKKEVSYAFAGLGMLEIVVTALNKCEFSDFEYNTETLSYNFDIPEEEVDTFNYNSINMKFANDELVYIELINVAEDQKTSYAFSDYGKTVVELPTNFIDKTTMVTADEWNEALKIENFYNVTFEHKIEALEGSMSIKNKLDYTSLNDGIVFSEGETSADDTYCEFVKGEIYQYTLVDGNWVREKADYMLIGLDMIGAYLEKLRTYNFTDFSYNANKGVYEYYDSLQDWNLIVKFDNGKLVSYEIKDLVNNQTNMSVFSNYGTTTVNLPPVA